MVKRAVVGAGYGLGSWLLQRITAVMMLVFTVVLVVAVLSSPGGYDGWRGVFANGWMRFAAFLALMSLFYHAWVGVRDIFMDYIKPVGLRLVLHTVVAFLLVGYAGWAASILWRL